MPILVFLWFILYVSVLRVKQAIAKKEDVVNQLRQQHAAAVKRADHLESLLEQQRKQLVKKKWFKLPAVL